MSKNNSENSNLNNLDKKNEDNNLENSKKSEEYFVEDFLINENASEDGIELSKYDGVNTQIKLSDDLENKEIVVKVKDIKKNYGKKEVLKGINLEIRKGERVALFGPNGAGKSTLTEIISQIKEPSSGEIEYSFGTTKKEISKKIGIQFQETDYPYYFKVTNIIKFFADLYKIKLTKSQLETYLEQFQLDGLEKMRADSLSGGQKQRLNIMLAVMNQPELLLLDEVSTGLDVQARTKIKKFIKDFILEKDSTLILVSHNPDEIEYLTERVIVIYDGIVWQDLKITKIIEDYGSFENYVNHLFLNEFNKDKNSELNSDEENLER